MYGLHLVQILAVAVLVNLVVHHEHLLRDELLVDLIGMHIRLACVKLTDLVFFADDSSSRIQTPQVVLYRVLNVHIGESEYVILNFTFRELGESVVLLGLMYHNGCTF